MPINVTDDTTADRLITEIEVTDAGNVNRAITEIRVIDSSGTDRIVFPGGGEMMLTATPDSVFAFTSGGDPAVTNTTTITVDGGTAPYTYAWTVQSYSSLVSPTVDNPTSATTSFTQTGIGASDYQYATFRCTVTDTTSSTATIDVTGTFSSIDGPFA